MLLMLSLAALFYLITTLRHLWVGVSQQREPTWYIVTVGFFILTVNAGLALRDYYVFSQPISLHAATGQLAASVALLIGVLALIPVHARRRIIMASHEYLLESMRDTYYRGGKTGDIMSISSSCYKLLGYSADELIGRNLRDFWEDLSDRDRLVADLETDNDVSEGFQTWLIRKDGSRVLVEMNSRQLRGANGEVDGVEGVIRDITERTRRDSQITELGRIIEASVHEIYVFDAETLGYLMVNRGARENTGYSMEDLTSMTVHELRPLDSNVDLEAILSSLVSGNEAAVRLDGWIRRKDGTLYSADMTFQYSRSRLQPVFFVFAEENTLRKQAEQEQGRSQRLRALGQMTGGVAHDFNNMLQALQLNLENIVPADTTQARWHKGAERVIDHAAQLTQRLLAVAGRQTLSPSIVDVNEVLENIAPLFKLTLAEAARLELHLSEEPLRIAVDEAQFESSLLNLVLNARDAMTVGGTLTITSSYRQSLTHDRGLPEQLAEGEYAEISIRDNGSGMSEETRRDAFEVFFTTKVAGEGTGLGLGTVRGFVNQSGGYMTLDSRLGEGTRVTLYFPFSHEEHTRTLTANEISISTSDAQILLIEDDPVVRELVSDALQGYGYRVLSASDAASAEQLARQHSSAINLIVSDILLANGESGPTVVERIIQDQGSIPSLFMSGHTREYWSNVYDFPKDSVLLQKPFKQSRLVESIEAVLKKTGAAVPRQLSASMNND